MRMNITCSEYMFSRCLSKNVLKQRTQILFHNRAQASQELSSTQGGKTRTRKESRRKTRGHTISEVR